MTPMSFGTWDAVFNIFLLILWYRMWTADDGSLFFNPYLAPARRVSDAIADFLRPVFFRVPTRGILAIAIVFLLVFRGLAVPRQNAGGVLFGLEYWRPSTDGAASCIAFSFASFAIFLFKIWGLSLIYSRGGTAGTHTEEALGRAAYPFTGIRQAARPLFLLAAGIAICSILRRAGSEGFVYAGGRLLPLVAVPGSSTMSSGLQLAVVAIAGWVDVLRTMISILMLLIIGSWVSMFAGSQSIMFFCREWIDMLLGPIRKYPIRIGMIDLSPLIFFFVVGALIHPTLMWILLRGYQAAAG